MSNCVVVRGWFIIEKRDVDTIKSIILRHQKYIEKYNIDEATYQKYSKGWCFASGEINGAYSAFYGAAIQGSYIDCLKDTLIEIAKEVEDFGAHLFLEDEKGHEYEWIIKDKVLIEAQSPMYMDFF